MISSRAIVWIASVERLVNRRGERRGLDSSCRFKSCSSMEGKPLVEIDCGYVHCGFSCMLEIIVSFFKDDYSVFGSAFV